MAYPSHYLLQFGGTRNTLNDEMWTCGIRMVAVGDDPNAVATKAYLETVCVPALAAWIGRATSLVASTAKLGFAKLNRIKADGLYAEPTSNTYFWLTPVPGAAGGTGTPATVAQCAVALTWETDAANRGLASRGRIYSPAPAVVSEIGTGLFAPAQALGMATSAATLIKALRGNGEAGAFTPNIVSEGSVKSGPGIAHRIDACSVDNRVDIIRKRANQIKPLRSRFVVPA